MPKPTKTLQLREYQSMEDIVDRNDPIYQECKKFAQENQTDDNGNHRPLLRLHKNQDIRPQNYVGILRLTSSDIEIYPKLPLTPTQEPTHHEKEIFYTMLRDWRGIQTAQIAAADIHHIADYPMLEAFKHLFLTQTLTLVKRGIAHHYHSTQENLLHLKGRLLFPTHTIRNNADKTRFYTRHDHYTPNTAANRLIRTAIDRLHPCHQQANERRRRQLAAHFHAVPASDNLLRDRQQHRRQENTRTTHAYTAVMQWINLFLFGHGLATYQGAHPNTALLFPMEQIFEDHLAATLRRHARRDHTLTRHHPQKHLVTDPKNRPQFLLKPDIVLKHDGQTTLIDAKWKQLDATKPGANITQADLYQLHTYAQIYGCEKVALVYPQNPNFTTPYPLTFNDNTKTRLSCHPFNPADPKNSAQKTLTTLTFPT